MTMGTAVSFKVGKKCQQHLYVKLKNGSIWRHNSQLSPVEIQLVVQNSTNNDRRVQLKNWTRVRAA